MPSFYRKTTLFIKDTYVSAHMLTPQSGNLKSVELLNNHRIYV